MFFKLFKQSLSILLLTIILFFKNSWAEITPDQLPTGANIVSGDITINQEPGKLTINQTSNLGVIEWDTFNLGPEAQIYFNHLNVVDSILNKVLDSSYSSILGKIYSNGKLFITNPNGISIGANASIDAHSFIAGAMNLANHDFLNRNYYFTQDREASLENLGDIKAQYVALMAPEIKNQGSIISKNGSAQLSAGDDMTLFINQDQSINITVNPSKIKAKASNDGVINSENGVVKIRADMAQDAIAETIKAPDNQADGFVSVNGVIKLVANSGQIRAQQVELAAGPNGGAEVSGSINVNSDTGQGGNIQVTGKEVTIKSTASLEAKGATGGGEILVGGSWQNTDPSVQQATYTTAEAGSVIDASATENGDGGTVVLWSDIHNKNSVTTVNGILFAKAGISGGNGGQIETSASWLQLGDAITVSTKAVNGKDGEWLLDPNDLWIRDPSWSGYNYETTSTTTYTAKVAVPDGSAIVTGAYTMDRGGGVTTLRTDTIVNALNSGNVRVLASGLINVSSWQSQGTANYYINSLTTGKLTLEAGSSIYFDSGAGNKVINLPNGTLELLAGTSISQASSEGGSINAGTLILGKCVACSTNPSVTLTNHGSLAVISTMRAAMSATSTGLSSKVMTVSAM